MIYELRIYTLKGGSTRELERRFGNNLDIRNKYSKMYGFWHTEIGQTNQIVHIWPYKNLRDRSDSRAGANRDESNRWPPGIAEFFERQEVEVLTAAPFMKPLEGEYGKVYELITETFPPNDVQNVLKSYGEAIPIREKIYPIAGIWYTDIGNQGRIRQIWVYKDWDHREQVMVALEEETAWPPQLPVDPISRETRIMHPAAFSPLD